MQNLRIVFHGVMAMLCLGLWYLTYWVGRMLFPDNLPVEDPRDRNKVEVLRSNEKDQMLQDLNASLERGITAGLGVPPEFFE